jgi:4-hydroxybutyrate dehydrogenase
VNLISYLTRICFGEGAIAGLAAEAKAVGLKRPLLVTDTGIIAAGLIDCVLKTVPQDVPLFDDTPENPTEEAVLACLDKFRDRQCDGIIAVGGGSPIDLAKAVALLASHSEPLAQYAVILGGLTKITSAVVPVLSVPTTAGTGSEVGRAALITLNDGRKLALISPHLIPKVAICDPELTLGLPARLTAATGMDAITHCIETFLSPRYNPPAEAIALDGLARGYHAIRTAVTDGVNLQARREMMMAALEGGLTFQKGLGAVHSMSHALGSLKSLRLHHGTLNAVLLPVLLRFNYPCAADKYRRLAESLGLRENTDLADIIEQLNADLGLPADLGQMGVTSDLIPDLVEKAFLDHSTETNIRPCIRDDFERLFLEAIG